MAGSNLWRSGERQPGGDLLRFEHAWDNQEGRAANDQEGRSANDLLQKLYDHGPESFRMAGFVRESAIRTLLPAALALAQHCRRAVRLPAHDRRASSTLQTREYAAERENGLLAHSPVC